MEIITMQAQPYNAAVGRDVETELVHAMLSIGEGCTRQNLIHAGFSETEIERHWMTAAGRANRSLHRRVA